VDGTSAFEDELPKGAKVTGSHTVKVHDGEMIGRYKRSSRALLMLLSVTRRPDHFKAIHVKGTVSHGTKNQHCSLGWSRGERHSRIVSNSSFVCCADVKGPVRDTFEPWPPKGNQQSFLLTCSALVQAFHTPAKYM
jgi:hypothetical protein